MRGGARRVLLTGPWTERMRQPSDKRLQAGSTPAGPTDNFGRFVQWQDICLTYRRRGFDSLIDHWFRMVRTGLRKGEADMARTMKRVTASRARDNVLVIVVDPLKVARGHRVLPRGGKHGSAKHLDRAKSKRQWRQEADGRPDAA
jgi:hypothetical protein